MPQSWAAADRLGVWRGRLLRAVWSQVHQGLPGRDGQVGWETEVPAALGLASPLGVHPGHRAAWGQGCCRGSGLAPGTCSFRCRPVPPKPSQICGTPEQDLGRILGPFLRSQETSLQALSTQQVLGNYMRPWAQRAGFAVATWAWAADPGVITHPLTGLRRRMETWSHQEGVCAAALGWLGVYGSFGLEPQLLQAVLLGRAKERQLDSAQLLSQTQLSCS